MIKLKNNIKYDRFRNNYKQKDFTMSNNINNIKGFLIGFLAGGTIGAIIALLTTPKSGKEIRGDIKHKSEEYFDDADKYYTDKKNKASKIINEGKRKYSMIMKDIKSKPGEILKDVEAAFDNAKENAKDILQSGKEKLETETDSLKYSFKNGVDGNDKNKKI
jgi:gas vesicle protein